MNPLLYLEWSFSELAAKFPLLFIILAKYLPFLTIFPLAYVFFYDKKRFFEIMASTAISVIFAMVLAKILAVPRPPALEGRPLLLTYTSVDSYSTPSRHASLLGQMCIASMFDPPMVPWLFCTIFLLNSLGRVAVGLHRTLDILSATWSMLFATVLLLVYRKISKQGWK